MRAARNAPSRSASVASGAAKSRLARMLSWNRCGSCGTRPIAACSDSSVRSCTSCPSTRTAPCVDVVDAGHEHRDRGLARARRADERDRLARLDRERDVAQDPVARLVAAGRARRLQRLDRHLVARRVAEPHVVELDAALRVDEVDRAGPVGDRGREVEHLEHPLERHERGEDVDARVRELRERLVHLPDVDHERDDGARS